MKRSYRKFRSVWIDITFSVTIILLTLSAILLIYPFEDRQSSQPDVNKTGSSPPIEIEEIDSNYPGVKIITKTSNDLNAPFAIQYPQSIHNLFNKEIVEYISEAQSDYLELMNNKRKLDEKTTGELNISFETILHHSGNYSFVLLTSSSFSDAAKGKMEIRSFHLNPDSGERYSLVDLLDHDVNKLNEVASLVRQAIQNDESLTDHLLLKSLEYHTQPYWKNFRNYAISDESIIFYFDENTIADKTVGPPIISIPIAKIEELLTDVFSPEEKEDTSVIVDKPSTDATSNHEANENVNDDTSNAPDEESEIDEIGKSNKKVALTFDDGPDPKVTRQILEILKKHDAKATFFMLGSRVEYYPEVVNEVKEAGHELGNHTWNHADLTKLNNDRINTEINNTSQIIEKVTGQRPDAFRPPYGAVNDKVRNQTDLPIVLWDVDTLDWKHRDPEKLLETIKTHTKDGSIILMHDIHQSTADGLDAALTYLESDGYKFVTMAELKR